VRGVGIRRGIVALAAALVAALSLGLPGTVGAGPTADQCRAQDEHLYGTCRFVEGAGSNASATCRRDTPVDDESCATPLGPRVSEARIQAYRDSWTHRALGFQYELGSDLTFADAPWVGTHNSFNSASEPFTLSGSDHNHQLSLTDQLRIDVRSIELDVHWFRSREASGERAPVLCHARGAGEQHAGCTTERLLADGLREVKAWLEGNPGQVLLVYLEDHLDPASIEGQLDRSAGYDATAAVLNDVLGPLLYRPPAGGSCTQLPLADLSREDVRASGAQVAIMSGCGQGTAWRSSVFGDDNRAQNEGGPEDYQGFPTCGPPPVKDAYDFAYNRDNFVRYYEDSTVLSANTGSPGDGITPETAGRMARCGVDLLGFDQLLPDDGRLDALVWSWASADDLEGKSGDCAVETAGDASWRSRDCRERHAYACRSAAGAWTVVSRPAGQQKQGADRCARTGSTFAAPRTGAEAQLLRQAMAGAGAADAWLGLRRSGGAWSPQDAR
jgi:hypothetical protein